MNPATDNTPDTAPDVEVKNPAALLAKNRKLLADVASLKDELQAAKQALEAQQQRADTLASDVHEMRVLRPWRSAIADLVGAGTARAMERCLSDLVQVVAGDDGAPVLLGKDGKPLEIKGQPVPVSSEGLFQLVEHLAETGEDLRPLLPRATGCGATGNDGRGYRYAAPKPAAPKPEAARANPAFGLR